PLGRGLYRVEQVGLFEQPCSFGDIAEFRKDGGGRLRFERVVEASKWTRFTFLLARGAVETPRVQAVLSKVMSLGGHWECSFGGVLSICLPPGETYDPSGSVIEDPPG
ncbi:MAG: DUF4265 domain-containing protein, partial [Thermoanaerobaculia bacterium]